MRTGNYTALILGMILLVALLALWPGAQPVCQAEEDPASDTVRPELIVRDRYNMDPLHFSKDPNVKIDYDIVYVRAPLGKYVWPDVGAPTLVEPGADLMLLHPDGRQEVLVEGGNKGSIADPFVSFDGESVYYALFYASEGADIYKIHVPTRRVVRLTHDGGRKAPGTDGARYSRSDDSQHLLMEQFGKPAAERDVIYNTGPCPVPGGKVVFTSNRNGFVPRKGTFTSHAFQLTVMDDDGSNVETIGHLNLGCALHPVILADGRIMFSSLENQGLRDTLHWSIWTINPDGTNWNPLISDFVRSLAPSFHFQTQRSDGRVVVEMYYNVNQAGFGTYVQLPPAPPRGVPAFGPADLSDPRNRPLRMFAGGIKEQRLPFSPYGIDVLTPFANDDDSPSPNSIRKDPKSVRVGKLTHPCGSPDNHILTVWSPGHDAGRDGITGGTRRVGNDTGIYLIKAGQPVYEPGQMLLIKNDPKYHEQWPRPLVPYERVHRMKEPKKLPWLANNGKRSPHLPEGTPFGLVGTSSLYKRESATGGKVPEGSVTAVVPVKGTNRHETPWVDQGSDAGVYANSDIHAIRILMQEPNLRPDSARFYNHARERLRILGEIPVRKFGKNQPEASATGGQPLDPDGNPDTSFLAKIPANTSFTFQTLDKHGMVLNAVQTWHQVRPGEIRNDCGGCHAHSQKPTEFKDTFAAGKEYVPFDLTERTPLLTSKDHDESGKKWDKNDETGLKYVQGVKDVEYWRDVRPIFQRSCAACHAHKADKPAGNLVLDDDRPVAPKHHLFPRNAPATYVALAAAENPYGGQSASRYVRKFQSRGSLLIWKTFGHRTDGQENEEPPQGKAQGQKPVITYAGSVMPPPDAVKAGKVQPLSDEDRRTLIRWIDLGCPIDLTYDPDKPQARGDGFLASRTLPTLTVSLPQAGVNREPVGRFLVGMHDRYSGLDMASFEVIADFPVDDVPAGRNLAARFKTTSQGVWELKLKTTFTKLARGNLTVKVADRQGNVSRLARTFSVQGVPE
jgi:hypothetical protein